MSDPIKNHKDPKMGALLEITSAMSSLNMYPELLPDDELHEDDKFLSQTDRWARHAMEHLIEAINQIEKIQ